MNGSLWSGNIITNGLVNVKTFSKRLAIIFKLVYDTRVRTSSSVDRAAASGATDVGSIPIWCIFLFSLFLTCELAHRRFLLRRKIKMNNTIFLRRLILHLHNQLPHGAAVEFPDGPRQLLIRTPADLLSPLIPLDNRDQEYPHEDDPAEIAGRILDTYTWATLHPYYSLSDFSDKQEFLDGLAFLPLSLARNRRLTARFPHLIRYDVLFLYTVSLPGEAEKLGNSLVTAELYQHFGLKEEDLEEAALARLRKEPPPLIMPLGDYLKRLRALCKDSDLMILPEDAGQDPAFVITNADGTCGASVLLYPGMPEALFRRFGPYYLLPSSIHELLLLPVNDLHNPFELRKTIRAVNSSMSDPLLILSDELYIFEDADAGLHIY